MVMVMVVHLAALLGLLNILLNVGQVLFALRSGYRTASHSLRR